MSSGVWGYFFIIGIVIGAILSFLSTKKILFTNKYVIKDEGTDKLLEEYNNK